MKQGKKEREAEHLLRKEERYALDELELSKFKPIMKIFALSRT